MWMESFCIASGLGYKAETNDQPESFNNIRAGYFHIIETSYTFGELISIWNTQAYKWTKYYVYLRLIDKDAPRNREQVAPTMLTFVTSALWHGIFSGFYLFFVAIGCLSLFCKTFERTELAHHLGANVPYPIKWFVCYYFVHINIAYFGMAFMLLFVDFYTPMFAATNYVFFWLLPTFTLIAFVLPMHKKHKIAPKEKNA
jgi:lysophospholipid acyltransferase